MLSSEAANAITYVTYALLLVSGLGLGYYCLDNKTFLSDNKSQKGFPLAMNFVASATGCGVITTFSQIGNIAGLHGLIIYCLSCCLPMFLFAFLGPIIRQKCPNGFVLTSWTFQRFGLITQLYLSLFTLLTLFLYMIAELSAIYWAFNSLTGYDGLPVVIVQCVVTTLYTSVGGFKVSFLTDNIQASFVCVLVVVGACAFGAYIELDPSIPKAPLLEANILSWKLLYILPVAIFTNDCFVSGFWLRTFASKTDKDLLIGCSLASFIIFVICFLFGWTGILGVWTGELERNSELGSSSFFILLSTMPKWIVGLMLIFSICISTCAFDTLQSSTVSQISNDIFKNKLKILYVRSFVVVLIVPCCVIALKVADDILQIYLIADLVSASIIPMIMFGLSNRYFWFLTGWEICIGGLSGLFSVFIFGLVYYDGNAELAGKLLIVSGGMYIDDWSTFGAFVVAPVASLVVGFFTLGVRLLISWTYCRVTGKEFTALDKERIISKIQGLLAPNGYFWYLKRFLFVQYF
ncbi:Dur3p [Ascoidea rubescens DSM 1968]|uniref:Urea transport protein n=1 Tax=Ascoidea rubescens DSM 1968 TaxID=1344418 RepID=A0A1D2VCY8_9ASCO|nr:urea transport protein [Ascoidea rubescens DSM 1968]ODV59337.1 urea transport protein [Ascoidea rubescens DSM 1968]